MQLSDAVEAFVDRGPVCQTPLQIGALEQFQSLLDDPSQDSLMRRLGAKDGCKDSEKEYLHILQLLNAMFFPGEIPFALAFYEGDDAHGDCSGTWREAHCAYSLEPLAARAALLQAAQRKRAHQVGCVATQHYAT